MNLYTPEHLCPLIIGATGGSGTRAFARVLRESGMFTGHNLNESEDSLDFGDYSDRWINTYLEAKDGPLPAETLRQMTEDFKKTAQAHFAPLDSVSRVHGWKEPRSIYLLAFFHAQFPKMKFIHVVRDGRDMAFSTNQNQLRKHGQKLLGGLLDGKTQAEQSISVWTVINRWAAEYASQSLGDRYLRLRFEDLCLAPVPTIQTMFEFAGLTGDADRMAALVARPPGVGRWQQQDPELIERLEKLAGPALKQFGYL